MTGIGRDTPLHIAIDIIKDDIEEPEKALLFPALVSTQNVNIQNTKGYTPLHRAVIADQ